MGKSEKKKLIKDKVCKISDYEFQFFRFFSEPCSLFNYSSWGLCEFCIILLNGSTLGPGF